MKHFKPQSDTETVKYEMGVPAYVCEAHRTALHSNPMCACKRSSNTIAGRVIMSATDMKSKQPEFANSSSIP